MIAQHLNEKGVKTAKGNDWKNTQVYSKEIRREDVPTTNRNDQVRTSLVKNVVGIFL